MAQERWWNWQDDDSTFRLNWRDLGIHEPGRYRGFDGDLTFAPLQLNLVHTSTGVTKTKLNLTTTPKIGVWLSKQGCVITEDSNIIIPITAGNTLPRIDLIVGQHEYTQIVGGTAATYSVITGTPSLTPVAPTLPFPEKQVILGALYVPANMISLTGPGVVYTPTKVPYFAGTQLSLDDNSDATVINAQNGDILLHDGVDFKNTNGKNYIQNLNIKMNNAFEEKAIVYSSAGAIPSATSGGQNVFNAAGANTFYFDYTSGQYLMAGLPNTYQIGSTITIIISKGRNTAIKFNHATTGAYLPIRTFSLNSKNHTNTQNQTVTNFYEPVNDYAKLTFKRMPNHWLYIEEPLLQNNLRVLGWVLGYFPDVVRGAGPTGFTTFGLATIGDSGLMNPVITNIMRTGNDAGYRIDLPISIPSDANGFLNYMVVCSMYSDGSTTTDGDYANDINQPISQNCNNNSFELYFREVASVVQTDILVDMLIIARDFTYRPI